eukprot:CAMPEP_0180202428 /NCGR_PEP_ID=MMETSP0987-20121128/7300_1 /TAXON_ID=697907 /ORGANISM="non described non described, Strain CCMP2293" /LENGTH=112 /DNA_ID=CAMNT_0022157705 /DNA_START=693 /DNA_END=1032 /DNA_ORIENTATION=-
MTLTPKMDQKWTKLTSVPKMAGCGGRARGGRLHGQVVRPMPENRAKYEKMAGEFPATKFLKVDVDANQEAASKCGILAMPTFQLFLKGEKIAQVEGADPAKLREIIAKHSPA